MSETGQAESDHLPLFVYGTLRERAWQHSRGVVKRVLARVPGHLVDTSEPFPAAIFEGTESFIEGELLWLQPDSYSQLLTDLDEYEGVPRLFRRVEVESRTDTGPVKAQAYEWVGETWEAYCDAAERKVAVAAYHQRRLTEMASSQDPIGVQAHFEGVLYAAIAASDQLAAAINLRYGLGLRNPNLVRAARAMPTASIQRALLNWLQEPIGPDLREMRRRATHHYYWKGRTGPRLVVQRPIVALPYGGSRELTIYCQAVLTYVERLGKLVDRFR